MAVVWGGNAPVTVREVLDKLNGQSGRKALAYTTVLTVMGNLARKGMLEQHTDGRAYRYSPAIPPEAYTAEIMNDALSAANDRTAALVYFAAQLDAAERNALLDQARRLRRRRRS